MKKENSADLETSYHEAGHAFMYWYNCIGIKKVTIIPSKEGCAHCKPKTPEFYQRIDSYKDLTKDQKKLTKYTIEIMCLLAGLITQKLYQFKEILGTTETEATAEPGIWGLIREVCGMEKPRMVEVIRETIKQMKTKNMSDDEVINIVLKVIDQFELTKLRDQKILGLAIELCGLEEIERYSLISWLSIRTESIIRNYRSWEAIKILANALETKKTLYNNDVEELLKDFNYSHIFPGRECNVKKT